MSVVQRFKVQGSKFKAKAQSPQPPPQRMADPPRSVAGPAPSHVRRCGFWGRLTAAIAVACAGAAVSCPVPAQARVGDERVETRVVTGDIVWAGKRAISVETRRTQSESEEMLLPFDESVKIQGPKSLTELKRGDRVSVSYRQTYREQEDGTSTLVKTVATTIALLRSASEGTLRSAGEGSSQ